MNIKVNLKVDLRSLGNKEREPSRIAAWHRPMMFEFKVIQWGRDKVFIFFSNVVYFLRQSLAVLHVEAFTSCFSQFSSVCSMVNKNPIHSCIWLLVLLFFTSTFFSYIAAITCNQELEQELEGIKNGTLYSWRCVYLLKSNNKESYTSSVNS